MNIKIAVVSVWAEDVSSTAHFYRDVVGLQLAAHHGERPHFDLDGAYLIILKGRPVPAQDPVPARFPIVAFAVPDLDAALDRLYTHQVELPRASKKARPGAG